MKRVFVLMIVAFALAACGMASPGSMEVRFVLEDRSTDVEDDEYSTTFYHRGVIRAEGSKRAEAGSYLVAYQIIRVSGGDPESPRDQNDWILVPIMNGRGEFRIYGGMKGKARSYAPADTFSIEVVRYEELGYTLLNTPTGDR